MGVPEAEIPLALLFFNLGIEVGQLAFVAAVLAAQWALRPLEAQGPPWLARLPAYGIGSFAAWWCVERAAVFFCDAAGEQAVRGEERLQERRERDAG